MKSTLAKKIDAKGNECDELHGQRLKNLEIANTQLQSRFDDLEVKYKILEAKLNKVLSSNRVSKTDVTFGNESQIEDKESQIEDKEKE